MSLINGLSNEALVREAVPTTAAGTSGINGTSLDMQQYENVLFVVKFGTAASDNTIHVEVSADESTWNDLAGSQVTVGSSDEIVAIDLTNWVADRYARVVVERGTSTTLDWGVAIRYGAHNTPVTNALAGTLALELHAGAIEGTK